MNFLCCVNWSIWKAFNHVNKQKTYSWYLRETENEEPTINLRRKFHQSCSPFVNFSLWDNNVFIPADVNKMLPLFLSPHRSHGDLKPSIWLWSIIKLHFIKHTLWNENGKKEEKMGDCRKVRRRWNHSQKSK